LWQTASDGAVELLDPLAQAISADPGVAGIAPPNVNLEAGVASIFAFPTTSPQDEATLDTVKRLRADVFPQVLGNATVSAHVGGPTAAFADIGAKVTSRLPLFISGVIALSFLLESLPLPLSLYNHPCLLYLWSW